MRRGAAVLLALLVASGCAPSFRARPAPIADAFRVTYRVDDRTTASARTAIDVVEVDRPFRGRVESRSGGRIIAGQITNREFFWRLGEGGVAEFGLRRAPGGAAREISYRALADAARYGSARVVGAGRILGRSCTWFAYRTPSPEALAEPTRDSRVESCVAPDGILLADVWTLDGRAVKLTSATAIRLSAPPSRRFFVGRDPTKERAASPEALRLLLSQFAVDDEAEVDLPTRLRAPRGWERDRRAVVSSTAGGGRATQFLVEAFVRDNELAVVERSTRTDLEPSWPPQEGARIDLGRLGSGRVVHYVDRVEVRLIGNVGFVRVSAPTRAIALGFVAALSDARL